jgi:hypothetical protein
MTTITTTNEQPPQMLLPQWMYRQIISDDSVKAVWCFCGAPAITYCNGLQFVCHGGGHFGVPMVMLKPRAEEQEFLEQQCAKGRELLRQQVESEARKPRGKRIRK